MRGCYSNWGLLFQKNIKQGGLSTYFLEKSPGIFHFITLPLEIPNKTKLHPWKFHKIMLHPLEITRPKTNTWRKLQIVFSFLVTPGNFTSFLINPWKFHMLFLLTRGNSIPSTPPCLVFFWNSPY